MSNKKGIRGFVTAAQRSVDEIRKDFASGGSLMAYSTLRNQIQPLLGDGFFAFFKDPPQLSDTIRLGDRVQAAGGFVTNPLPQVTTAAELELLGPVLDTRGVRAVKLTMEYFPGLASPVDGATLVFVVEDGIPDPETKATLWTPYGVVDPTLNTVAAAPQPAPLIECGAWRDIFASEFRVQGGSFDFATPCQFKVVFDTTDVDLFRLRAGELFSPESGLNVIATMVR